MSKAKIIIEYMGKTYRVGKSHGCSSKRDCDLFRRGVCDGPDYCTSEGLPCESIADAFDAIGSTAPTRCYKEVRRK